MDLNQNVFFFFFFFSGQFPKDFVNIITLPVTKSGEALMLALDNFYAEEKDDLPFKKG